MDPTYFGVVKALYAVILLGCIGFFFLQIFQRFKHLLKATTIHRTDRVGERIAGFFKYYLGQGRLFHGYLLAGLMHAFIFWGFWVVSVNTIHAIMGGFVAGSHLPWLGREQALGSLYILCRDIFEVLVLVMVALAGLRRLVTRPKRLTYGFAAHLVLILIAILMVSDFFISGAEAVATNPHRLSFVENLMWPWMSSWGLERAITVGVVAWWIHLLGLLYFLNLLPNGKHFHVVTSVFTVFFRRLGAPALSKINLDEAEEAEKFGAGAIYDHPWKYLLDSFSCTECGRCQDNCPAFLTEKELSPKLIQVDLRHYLFDNQRALLAGKTEADEEGGVPMLLGDTIAHQRIWDCTTCRACEEFCPLLIEHLGPIMGARRYLTMDLDEYPEELTLFFRNMESQANPWGIGQENRTAWAAGLDVPIMAENPDKEVLLWIGCSASFDARNQRIARALVKCLNAAGVDFGYLGEEETCNGDPARRAGHEYMFQMMAEQVVETIKQYKNLKKIITLCPHCFNIFANEYPQMGLEIEVEHHSMILARLVREGKLKPSKRTELGKLVYHDSCYLGRYNGVYSQPREVLWAVPGVKVVEAERHHAKGMCCGAGGVRMFLEESTGTRINHLRLEQLAAGKPDGIATACPFCLTMLDDAIKETDQADKYKIMDIAEVLAAGLEEGSA